MAECLKTLSAPVPPELIRQRHQGEVTLSYLEWFTVNRLLDARAPGWWGEVRSIATTADTVIVCYRISIPTAEGWIHREAVGSDQLGSGFDPVASAEQQPGLAWVWSCTTATPSLPPVASAPTRKPVERSG